VVEEVQTVLSVLRTFRSLILDGYVLVRDGSHGEYLFVRIKLQVVCAFRRKMLRKIGTLGGNGALGRHFRRLTEISFRWVVLELLAQSLHVFGPSFEDVKQTREKLVELRLQSLVQLQICTALLAKLGDQFVTTLYQTVQNVLLLQHHVVFADLVRSGEVLQVRFAHLDLRV